MLTIMHLYEILSWGGAAGFRALQKGVFSVQKKKVVVENEF